MKVAVIGIGHVGATLAYTLSLRSFVSELVLVNRSPEIAEGHTLDLEHAQSFVAKPSQIVAGGVEATENSDVIAFCASVPTPPDLKDRLSLGPKNVNLIREWLPALAQRSPESKLVMLSNPVDVLTYYAIRITGFPPKRVVGTGTLVDSARFRHLLSVDLDIHPDDLRAYILGEHGNSQFPAMSVALAGGELIEDNPRRRQLFERTVSAGLEIFKRKGYTDYAIAMAASVIIEAIALDQKHTLPVSTLIDDYLGVRDVCLSVPVVIGRDGVERVFQPELDERESEAFRRSAGVVAEAIAAAR